MIRVKTYGDRKLFNKIATESKLNYLISRCNIVARRAECICEVEVYPFYGWFCADFMTDKFGGIAAMVKFIEKENAWYLNDTKVESMEAALAAVPALVAELQATRHIEFREN